SGGADNDTIDGSRGNDSLSGDAGDDTITGGDGNDTISGGSGYDRAVFSGDRNAHNIYADGSSIYVELRDISDNLLAVDRLFAVEELVFDDITLLTASGIAGDLISGTSGDDNGVLGRPVLTGTVLDDVIDGLDGDDALYGLAGADSLNGGNDNDTLVGGAGNDTMTGGSGQDVFVIAPHEGSDLITDFTDGADVLDLSAFNYADIQAAISAATGVGDVVYITLPTGGLLTLNGITAADFDQTDVIMPSDAPIILWDGVARSTRLDGDSSLGAVIAAAGAGHFIEVVDPAAALAPSGTLNVDANALTLLADGPFEASLALGTASMITLMGSADIDVEGNALSNIINGNNGANRLSGDDGVDQLLGGDGNDTLDGGAQSDLLLGGLGTDWVSYQTAGSGVTVDRSGLLAWTGDAAGDVLFDIEGIEGSGLADTLVAGGGVTMLAGGDGNDSLAGSTSADRLSGDAGNDTLAGAAGDDIFVLAPGQGDDTILDFEKGVDASSGDKIDVSAYLVNFAQIRFTTQGANDLLVEIGNETVLLENVSVSALDASDFIGLVPVLTLTGSGGADTIAGTSGNDSIDGLGGNDSIAARGGDDTVNGGGGNDTIIGASGADSLKASSGADSVEGAGGNDTLSGGSGNDTLNGGGSNDVILGGIDNDMLIGGSGNDFLNGNAGDDTLSDGEGQDKLEGGAGADVFILATDGRNDRIADFENGVDQIQLGGVMFGDLAIADMSNGTVRITYAGEQLLLLEEGGSIASSDIDASDFIFV
ncbi:MAG: hypothetical protein OIF47_11125, partial [Marinibacterium sp.]|nr:hypothetical protein [Marinibacterium sp.]